MSSPIQFQDLFGGRRVEPSVTGLIEVETIEAVRPGIYNDLILLSPFRSGVPQQLKRFRSTATLAAYHDPDRVGDQGVAIARTTKAPFGDLEVFGAADIITLRVDPATPSTAVIRGGSVDLVSIATADHGTHTLRSTCQVAAGTVTGRKVTLSDGVRTFVGDNLGSLLSIRYAGAGSACALTLRQSAATLTYGAQPADSNSVTINGVVFEFESGGGVGSGHVSVDLGLDADEAFSNLAAAININAPGVTAVHDATANTVVCTAPEEGIRITTDFVATLVLSGAVVSVRTTVTGATGEDLALPLTLPQYRTIGALAAAIDAHAAYTCTVSSYADRFLDAAGLMPVIEQAIHGANATTLSGHSAAIANWVNTKTRGLFSATALAAGTADASQTPAFSGGDSQPATITDWDAALAVIGSEIELGAILLVNSPDPAVQAAVVTFMAEQRSAGKWFRAFFGAEPGLATSLGETEAANQYMQVAAALDSSRARLVVQRPGVFAVGGTITYLDPIYLAAALAGGAAGNKPYVNPLTNKRLRFAGVHPDDSFDVVTREALLEGGVTVVKKDNDRLVVSLAVTTSRDPDRRMPRIMSEIDTVDMIDADVRLAFLPFRGKWSTLNVEATAITVLTQVLSRYVREGALVAGVDEYGTAVPAYRLGNPAAVINAGIMTLEYQIFIGGELNHISLHGTAEYQRLVGTAPGASVSLSTAVPLR